MGNLNCNQYSVDHPMELRQAHFNRTLKSTSPIKIEQVIGEPDQPLLTTVRHHQDFIESMLRDSKEKRKKTEKEMAQFIDGLIQKGNQSKKHLDEMRKQKLVMQTRRDQTKKLSFNLNRFLFNQEQFLNKKNMSLERSRQALNASKAEEETHQPKINQNSRRIAIQVSGRRVVNKKKVVLKNPLNKTKTAKWLNHDSPTISRSSKQKHSSKFDSNQKFQSSKVLNESYLQKKLQKQFDDCCKSLGLEEKINYLQFTNILQMMNFANRDLKQRAMLLDGWNLLAGSRIAICRKLVFSFILSLFGIQLVDKVQIQTECRSVDNDSPTRIKQDLDYTFLTLDNEKRSTLHQDRLDEGLVEYIQQEYKPLRYNKLSENESSPSKINLQEQQNFKSLKKNEYMVTNYRQKIVIQAESMNILQPLLGNKELNGYQIGVLSKNIRDRLVYNNQLQNQLRQKAECTFEPSLTTNRSNSRNFNLEGSKEKAKTEKYNIQQSTLDKRRHRHDPILQIEVNTGSRVEKIAIFEGDNIDKLAEEFLQRNNLSSAFKQKLILMIEQGLEHV